MLIEWRQGLISYQAHHMLCPQAAPRRTPQQPGCFLDKGAIGSGQKGRQMVHQVCEQTGMCSALTRERCARMLNTGGP